MKKLLKSNLHTLAAAVTLGALSIGFVPAAMAATTYSADSSFSLTLTDVSACCGTATSGWSVDVFGGGFVDTFTSGVATATGDFGAIDPAVSMSISDSVTQWSTASGSASNGSAWTDVLTDLDITVANTSGGDLTFSFSYDIVALASALGQDATANATVDLLDDLGFVNILAIADANVMPGNSVSDASQIGSFSFTLMDGEVNVISGFVDSIGSANAVPVPAAVWLFGTGLLGLVGVARRKQAA